MGRLLWWDEKGFPFRVQWSVRPSERYRHYGIILIYFRSKELIFMNRDDRERARYSYARRWWTGCDQNKCGRGRSFQKWLQITDFRAQHSGGVHFAVDVCDLICAMLYGIWGSMTLFKPALPENITWNSIMFWIAATFT